MQPRSLQHSAPSGETRLIYQALAGDIHAVDKLLQYLGSNNPNLRKIMLDSIRTVNQSDLYEQLLHCLAMGDWEIHTASGLVLQCSRRSQPLHAERIEASIIELFSEKASHQPESAQTNELIETVLHQAMKSELSALRHAAACLLASRGDPSVIPVLADAIQRADLHWKIRAVQALADLDDPLAGPPLVKALAMQSDELHEEARRALCELGEKAEPAWISALNHPDSHIRWHAARGLGEIGDQRALDILAEGLTDDNQAVRWATARVLARMDAAAVPAILNVIGCNPLSEPFRQAVIHALHAMPSPRTQARIKPVLTALKNPGASMSAPGVARRLLTVWQRPVSKKKNIISGG